MFIGFRVYFGFRVAQTRPPTNPQAHEGPRRRLSGGGAKHPVPALEEDTLNPTRNPKP